MASSIKQFFNKRANGCGDVRTVISSNNDNLMQFTTSNEKEMNVSKIQKKCEPCGRDRILENANMYCSDCAELLCKECAKHHKRNKFTTTHKLSEIKEDADSLSKLNYLSRITKCGKHSNEEVKYLCRQHDQLCCNECAIVEHRLCRDLVSIGNESSAESSLDDIEQSLSKLKSHASLLLSHELNAIERVFKSAEEVNVMLKHLKGVIESAFNSVEQALAVHMNQMSQDLIVPVQSRISTLQHLTNCFEHSDMKLSAVREFGQQQEQYLVRRDLSFDTRKHVEVLAKCHSSATRQILTLTGGDIVRQEVIQSLGHFLEVNVTYAPETLPPFPDLPKVKIKFAKTN